MKKIMIFLLSVMMLTTGCNKDDSAQDDNSAVTTTTQPTQTTTVTDDLPTEPEAINLDTYLVDNEEGIYNLSELDSMKDIDVKNAVMADENTVYFLAGDNAEMLMGLDLLTGSVYDIATVDINANEVFYAASIINLDPIIIYYSFEEGVKYFLIDDKRNVKDTTDIFTDNMSVSSYKFTEDGKLYFYNELSSKLMNVDLESFELEDVFVLPADYNYSSLYGVDESGEQAVIRAVTTHGSREVTILADLKSGNVNKVYEGNIAVDFSAKPFFTFDFALENVEHEGMGVDINDVYVRYGKGLEQYNELVSLQDILQEDYNEFDSWIDVIELVPDLNRAIFIASTSETRQLVLWDYSKSEYTKLPEDEHKEFVLERLTIEGLSEKALALEEKYGIKVYIGEEVREAPYPDYTITPETDMVKIRDSLDMLENTLALYPDDYFEQLKGDDVRCICFYLVGSMQPIDSSVSIADPAGLSYLDNGLELIAISTDYGWSLTVVHELNHVLDHRLEETGILDEEKWNSFNPQGFDYYYAYVDDDGNEVEYIASTEYTAQSDEYIFDDVTDNIYFVDTYCKTFPTEDRARLMELVVISEDDFVSDFLESEHVRAKLNYYYELIDEYFDTSSWGTTAWERTLERAEAEDNAA